MCAGLLVPALVGALILTQLHQAQMVKEVEGDLAKKISVLVISLADPVWDIDTKAISTIAHAVLSDPQVVRITVSDPKLRTLLNIEHAERRLGRPHVARRPMEQGGSVVGHVELELDDGLRLREFDRNRSGYIFVLMGQFTLALLLTLWMLRHRVLRPLARLNAFSDQLASGNLDQPLDWNQPDAIGRLAHQLDQMRSGLRTSFTEQKAILNNVQTGVIFARGRTIELTNRHAERIFGYDVGEMRGRSSRILYQSQDQFIEVSRQVHAALSAVPGVYEQELRLTRRDGSLFWARMRGSVLETSTAHKGSIWVFDDITEHHRASAQFRLAATVFENTAEGVIITDSRQCILAVNKSFERITGYSAAEVVGRTPALLKSGQQGPEFYSAMWRSLDQHRQWQGEITNRRKNGEIYPERLTVTAVFDTAGELAHYVGVFSDITLSKTAEDEIRRLAFYDPLTLLPNRRLMLDRLSQALISSVRQRRPGALMMIDLDNFKTLNDTLGHDVGDQLLVSVATRLQSCVREGDTVARLGGDEFVVILENLDASGMAAPQAESVAHKILKQLSQPYLLNIFRDGVIQDQRHYHCTSSLGIALFQEAAVTVDELMKRADTAMYQAKAAGRSTLRFFDPEMQALATARAALEVDLRRALAEQQFLLYYQAQLDASGQVIGAEVLARWQHPQRGLVPPFEFIPLAEETGLILALGQWVLQTACDQLTAWAARPAMAGLTLAVNVSARQFRHADFVQQVLATLEHSGANPQRLKLELTESMLVDDIEGIINKMTALKAHGIGFSLDDFGTGYSSLSYLTRLPLDQLKIDQSFVRDILTNVNDAAIVRTIVALGESLGLMVIAEGVETLAQRDCLAHHGCLVYQGYFANRPAVLPVFEDYVAGLTRAAPPDAWGASI